MARAREVGWLLAAPVLLALSLLLLLFNAEWLRVELHDLPQARQKRPAEGVLNDVVYVATPALAVLAGLAACVAAVACIRDRVRLRTVVALSLAAPVIVVAGGLVGLLIANPE